MKNLQKMFLKIGVGAVIFSLSVGPAFAAALTNMSDTLSSAKIGVASNHSFVFTTPSGIGTASTTIITFPQEFIIPFAFSFTDVDMNVGGPYLGTTTLAATPTGSTFGVTRTSSTTLTLTSSSSAVVAPGSVVYIRLGTNAVFGTTGVNQVINATTTGNKAIGITGSMWDNGTTTVNMLTDDAVVVNAVVPQTLSFSISSNSINFGNLTTANAKYASSTNGAGDIIDTTAHTLDIGTNAPSGYTITVQGQTLTSQQNAANTISAIGASPAASNPTTEQFGIYATKAGGVNGTIGTPFATASSFGYSATATTSVTFASGTTATSVETYSLHYLANIASLTEAGTYSASLIYVGTSNF